MEKPHFDIEMKYVPQAWFEPAIKAFQAIEVHLGFHKKNWQGGEPFDVPPQGFEPACKTKDRACYHSTIKHI